MKTIPELVDENGDIQLHGRQGAVIPINFTNDDGTPRDMTGVSVVFECGPGVNIPLTAGATDDEMLLTLTNANVKAIEAQSNRQFVLLENATTPHWMGTVYLYGWVE